MTELHLQSPEEWDRYLRLLVTFEGREAEFNARASLLIQVNLEKGMERPEAVRCGLNDAERVERALNQQELVVAQAANLPGPTSSPRHAGKETSRQDVRWWVSHRPAAALGAALAAGLLIGVLIPHNQGQGTTRGDGLTNRGAFTWDSGSIKLWGDALPETPPLQRIGQGRSPLIKYHPGTLLLMWRRPPDVDDMSALGYLLDANGSSHALNGEPEGFTRLDDVVEFDLPSGVSRLVIITYPTGDDPRAVMEEAGDGQAATASAGVWQMIVFQLVEETR